MNCEKHPNYNGLRWKKLRCSTCDAIYKEVHKKQTQYGNYKSLTTPNWACGLNHLLTEISCLLRFGTLPPYFWRVNAASNIQVRTHFQKTFNLLKGWQSRDPDYFKQISKLFYYLYLQYAQQDQAMKVTAQPTEVAQEIVSEEKAQAPAIDLGFDSPTKINPWEILND